MSKDIHYMDSGNVHRGSEKQYMTYDEMVKLLQIAHNDLKVDEYLTERGFEYHGSKNQVKLLHTLI